MGGGGPGRKIDIQSDTPHRHVTPVPFRAALGAEGGAEAPARRAGGGWCLSRWPLRGAWRSGAERPFLGRAGAVALPAVGRRFPVGRRWRRGRRAGLSGRYGSGDCDCCPSSPKQQPRLCFPKEVRAGGRRKDVPGAWKLLPASLSRVTLAFRVRRRAWKSQAFPGVFQASLSGTQSGGEALHWNYGL